jgi:hypothetical protein
VGDRANVLVTAVAEKPCATLGAIAPAGIRDADLSFNDDAAPDALAHFNETPRLAT